MLDVGLFPNAGRTGMLEADAASGEILGETAPRCEVEPVGLLDLREVTFQARTLCEQSKNALLVEDVDLILPHHVVDGRKALAVANEQGSQNCELVVHDCTLHGIGIESAAPDRYTGCG